MLNYAGLRF